MRRVFLALCGALLLTAQAPAGNSVSAHYNAYRAALAAGDMAAAEREAAQAFDASVARDGDGGSTGALAVNLAMVRLALSDKDGAYEPALRAQSIVQSGGALDPLLVNLLLGRSQLTEARGAEGTRLLLEALPQARGNAEIITQAYDAAREAALWNSEAGNLPETAAAWGLAADFAQGSPGDHTLALATARIAQGAALYSLTAGNEDARLRAGLGATGSNIRALDGNDQAAATAAFVSAAAALHSAAMQPGAGDGLTVAQVGFATAMAWHRFIAARVRTLSDDELDNPTNISGYNATNGALPCALRVRADPLPRFPQIGHYTYGAVVVRVLLTPEGEARDIRVAAAVPSQEGFADAVARVAPRWSVERSPNALPNCEMKPVNFVTVAFGFR